MRLFRLRSCSQPFNKERLAILCVDETLFWRIIYAQAARTHIFPANRRRPSENLVLLGCGLLILVIALALCSSYRQVIESRFGERRLVERRPRESDVVPALRSITPVRAHTCESYRPADDRPHRARFGVTRSRIRRSQRLQPKRSRLATGEARREKERSERESFASQRARCHRKGPAPGGANFRRTVQGVISGRLNRHKFTFSKRSSP